MPATVESNVKNVYTPDSILFQWHVTDSCNLRCSHCYQDSPPAADPSWEGLMSILQQFKAFIVNCRNTASSSTFHAHITVTGGEPFLRADFLFLLEKLAEERQSFSFAILTNGTLLTPTIVASLQKLRPSFVQVSIDGAKETHDRIRGPGSYERAVAGLKLLIVAGVPAYISFTAQRGNYRDFPDVAQLGRRLGAGRVWSDRMVPCAQGHKKEASLMLPEQTLEFVSSMDRERRRDRFRPSRVALHRSLQFTATGASPYRCSAGDTLVTVLPNGDVCPCRRMPLVAGNIHREPLEDIYRHNDIFRNLREREHISRGCEKCFYARTCGGGSRCIALAVHGDPFHADPGCWLANQVETPLTI